MSLPNLTRVFSGLSTHQSQRCPDQPPPPSPFEPVARSEIQAPIIIQVPRPNPLQSARSRELHDLIHPEHGDYTRALGRFARSAGINVKEVWLAIAMGGEHSIVVTSDRLPTGVPSSSWTSSRDGRTFEYQQTKFRFELEDDYEAHIAPATVGGMGFNHYPLPWSIGPIAQVVCQTIPPGSKTRSGAGQHATMHWGITVAHNFPENVQLNGSTIPFDCRSRPVYVRTDGTQNHAVSNRTHELTRVAAKPQWLDEPKDLGAYPFEDTLAVRIVPLNVKHYIDHYLQTHAHDLSLPANRHIDQQLRSITKIGPPLAISTLHVDHDPRQPMVCFKVGITTSLTVGTLTELRITTDGNDTRDHAALIAPAPFAAPFSRAGDSGSMVFGIDKGHACPIALLQGSLGPAVRDHTSRTKCYSLPQALHHMQDHNHGVMLNYSVSKIAFHQSASCFWR